MVYFNLKVIVSLKEDIKYENTYQKISDFIAFAMLQNEQTKELHEKNTYKMYNFCSLYPFEKDGIYKKGRIYTFDIKFIDMEFAMKIKQLISIISSNDFQVIMSNIEVNEYKKINKLVTLTPCILTKDNGDYKIEGDLELVKARILANIEKKYKQLYGVQVEADFIENIIQTNRTPIKLPYKNIHLLGNKFEIEVKQDELSQKLAHLALSTGVLEKNSQGYGFCKAR